ncbi:linear amide C-N hydrolase [Estrella lausannensis]|uniref:Choloylglycine hydrolase n=1 Tax=Estrella lausannensis TaxID=483423 RepID=A0A0H5DPH0_9BACT|nr:choloylglycine hydrolase family protein [Estrella lausannensis]CRX38461.1 choloylglycine hydrolase [Estrella lausannensis]
MKISSLWMAALAASFTFASPGEACTGIKLTTQDGSLVHGRTLEFGIDVDISVAVVPRGYPFKGTTPKGEGMSYKSKYGAVGAIAFGNPALMDGINEKGLAVGTFYFPGYAEYTETDKENQERSLSPAEFSNWILTQFESIEEVKAALPSVVIAPTVIPAWGSQPPPFHYIVYDKSGNSLVIEPVGGNLLTYDNKLGTLTNSPEFDWHMSNLRNYINLTPFNVQPITLNGVTLKPFGEGSGMVGMPGDFTPPSRFVRAAIYSTTAIPSKNAEEGILQVFHILNQFDIPIGVARTKENNVVYTDQTLMTAARDPQTLKYYYKSYRDQSVKMVDLKKFDLDAKEIKSLKVSGNSIASDVSSNLK